MRLSQIAIIASLALTACAPNGRSPNAQRDDLTVEVQDNDSPSMRHKFRANPSPKQHYDITMIIKDAPGSFDLVEFWAHYLASDCIYWTSRFAGTTARPTHTLDIPFKKLNEETYVGTVYLDAMVDEDYYDDGICHWQLTEVAVGLKATGAYAETRFLPDISAEYILTQGTEAKYFWSGYYPRANMKNFYEFGAKSLETVPVDKRGEFFTIALASKEMQPSKVGSMTN